MGLIVIVAGAAVVIERVYHALRATHRLDDAIETTRRQAGLLYQIADVVLRIVDVLLGFRKPTPPMPPAVPAVRFGVPAAQVSA